MKPNGILATIAVFVSCVFLTPAFSRADTITTFDVSGQYRSPSSGTFSGTLTVDGDQRHGNGCGYHVPEHAYIQRNQWQWSFRPKCQ